MSELDRAMVAALSCFRAALEAASAHPSDEAVAVLRDAAVPIMARLRAEYVADGSPYGDESEGLFRWARGKILAGGTLPLAGDDLKSTGARVDASGGLVVARELELDDGPRASRFALSRLDGPVC
jgi:hypothetical protein